jgi:hypothetical protein
MVRNEEVLLKKVYDTHMSYLIGVGNNWIVNGHPPKKSEYKDYMKEMLEIMKKIERRRR